jgi:polyribonucleotide nucleotidyltransferase
MMQKEAKSFTAIVGDRPVTFETGKLAGQAGGAVTIRLGDSIVFSSATMSKSARVGMDFFPLTIEYEERMYAGGQIPGSFFRREGRPSSDAILTSRLTDRPLRPLFPKDMRNDVQVINMSISADDENPLDILVLNAASAALTISNIPWDGPVGAVRVGRIDGQFIANPTYAQIEESDLDLRIAGTRDAVLMVECGASEVPEDVIVEALEYGHKALQPLVDVQEKMAAEIGKTKDEPALLGVDETIKQQVYDKTAQKIGKILEAPYVKADMYGALDALEEETVTEIAGEDETLVRDVKKAFDDAMGLVVRNRILNQGKRPDGRGTSEIRPIWCEVGASPQAHGSGIFTRGETQAFTLATLGTLRDAQAIDTLSPVSSKRYIHHYNFPPYCVGEVRMLRGTSRRDIGHGNLAERALVPVIPAKEEFPYTIRVVSEIMSSNGSSSMASICGSTLALMDTGVPIKAPVSGVAMGLILEGEKAAILTDIMGIEDHLGDMDFKVAGTEKGITALQMDIKVKGITTQIMSDALAQGRTARMDILNQMLEVISTPNAELKPHTPRISTVQVPVDKIGAIIGPGGKMIRALQEETDTRIDIEDDGTVFIAANNSENEKLARDKIQQLTETPIIGRLYTGKVVRTTDFGAFIEILPGIDGMVHISQLDSERVERVEDIVQVGDEATVMVTAIDQNGKIRLSRQAVLEGWTPEEAQQRDQKNRSRSSGNRSGGNRSGGNRQSGSNRSGGNRSR